MLVREELGLDPDELGSPWGAAAGSFVAFAIGASIPVIPYLFGGGTSVLLVSLGLSLIALFTVGAARQPADRPRSLFSGAPPARDRAGRRARDLRDRFAHRRHDGRLTRWRERHRRAPARRRARPVGLVERTGRPLRGPRPCLRQGHRRRARLDPVRAPGDGRQRSTSPRATGSSSPAGTAHDAVVGPAGVTCLEAHLPAGTLAAVRRRAAGTW